MQVQRLYSAGSDQKGNLSAPIIKTQEEFLLQAQLDPALKQMRLEYLALLVPLSSVLALFSGRLSYMMGKLDTIALGLHPVSQHFRWKASFLFPNSSASVLGLALIGESQAHLQTSSCDHRAGITTWIDLGNG